MSEQLSPGVIFALPLIFIPIIYLLRQWRAGAYLSIGVALLMAFSTHALLDGRTIEFLGRTLITDTLFSQVWAFLWLATTASFALSLGISQGWTFYPLGMAIVTFLGLAIAMPHLGIAALMVTLAALLAVFIIQGGRLGSVRAAQRFLIMMVLALPFFLLAALKLDSFDVQFFDTELLASLTLFAVGGFALWLGVSPLHGWITAVSREALPGISAFIFIAFPTTAIVLLLRFYSWAPAIVDVPHLQNILFWGAAFSILIGGIFAASQNAFSPLMGYALLYHLGCSLIAIALQNEAGMQILFFAFVVRALALLAIAMATAFIRQILGDDSFERTHGIAQRFPIIIVGLMLGAASLAGAPLTAGFVERWSLLKLLGEVNPALVFVVLLGGIGVSIGYLRGLWGTLRPANEGMSFPGENYFGIQIFIIIMILALVAIGIFPVPIFDWVNNILTHLQLPLV